MTQYRRKGQDWSTNFDTPPSPDHWEPLETPKPPAPAVAADPEPKES